MELYSFYKWTGTDSVKVISYHASEEAATEQWDLWEAEDPDFEGGITIVRPDSKQKAVNALNAALQGILPA
jgi:hypothetical protein